MSQERTRRFGRYAVLRFALFVEYYPTARQAKRRLSKLRGFERVAVVDRATGRARCRRKHRDLVAGKLESAGTAPRSVERTGGLGSYLRQDRRTP